MTQPNRFNESKHRYYEVNYLSLNAAHFLKNVSARSRNESNLGSCPQVRSQSLHYCKQSNYHLNQLTR